MSSKCCNCCVKSQNNNNKKKDMQRIAKNEPFINTSKINLL